MSRTEKIEIHSKNIFPIIKKWLYSEREIFLRELVSNSIDAITKLNILKNKENIEIDDEFKVKITFSKENNTISVADNGLGMTETEIKKYLGQIAFSGAEEFVQKYKGDDDDIIGHFGLGFYSSFMVSSKVSVDTLSYKKDAKPVKWECEGEPEYTLAQGERKNRGTTVTLHITDEEKEFVDKWKLRDILRTYCRFLPYAIYLEDEQINPDPPLWKKTASEIEDQEYLDFYKKFYPGESEPHFWVHINADYPFKLEGILYFPKMSQHEEIKADKLQLYCNRVFVSGEMNVLLPDAISYLRGFLDSPDIPLNVSRSFLQQDPKVRKISSFITRKIADRLVQLVDEDREKYIEMWENISPYIKLAAIRDAKFNKKVKDAILFQKSDKTDWISIDSLLEKDYGENWTEDKETEHHVYYGVYGETLQSLINLYKDSAKTIIMGEPPIDSHFFNFCESNYTEQKVKFKRIDSELGTELIAENPQELVDSQGNTSKDRILTRVKSILQEVEIEGEWLKNQEIPMVLIFPEFERRFREMTAAMGNTDNQLFKHKCFINLNHDLIARLDPAHKDSLNKELAADAVKHIYTLALLPHKTLKDESLDNLFVNAGRLFAKLGGTSTPNKQQKSTSDKKEKEVKKTASKKKKVEKTTEKKQPKEKSGNSKQKS